MLARSRLARSLRLSARRIGRRPTSHASPLRRLLLIGAVAALLVAVLWHVVAPRLLASDFLEPQTDGYVVVGQEEISPGDVIYFGVLFSNQSDRMLELRPISFPRGLPPHVHLVHTDIMPADEQKHLRSLSGGVGWPPDAGGSVVLHPVEGYRLGPHALATIVYAVTADTVGTFTTGPLTVNALAPLLPGGVDALTLPVSMTYRTYGVLCMQDHDTCEHATETAGASG